MDKQVNVGIIGCGKISEIYLKAAKSFPNIQIVACADIKQEVAKKKAKEHGIEAMPVERLLIVRIFEKEIKVMSKLSLTSQHHNHIPTLI